MTTDLSPNNRIEKICNLTNWSTVCILHERRIFCVVSEIHVFAMRKKFALLSFYGCGFRFVDQYLFFYGVNRISVNEIAVSLFGTNDNKYVVRNHRVI